MFTPYECLSLAFKIVALAALAIIAGVFFQSVFFVTVFTLGAMSCAVVLLIFGFLYEEK